MNCSFFPVYFYEFSIFRGRLGVVTRASSM
jgi:hypothetical protein